MADEAIQHLVEVMGEVLTQLERQTEALERSARALEGIEQEARRLRTERRG